MASFNKLLVASEMFVEAHERYTNARSDIDYVASILLSGAVLGIVAPLLKEQGGHTTHSILARIGNSIGEVTDPRMHEGMFRVVYNALKHSGNDRQDVLPSADLVFETDLRLEAAEMLDAAKQDFKNIEVAIQLHQSFSPRFVELLESVEDYA